MRLDPDESEAHVWLAEIALRERRLEDGHASISRAIASAQGVPFAAHLVRLRLNLEEVSDEGPPEHQTDHLRAPLGVLCPELASAMDGVDRAAWRNLVDRALERLHGNRSSVATFIDRDALTLVPSVRDPRAESRRLLELCRLCPEETLLDELSALAQVFPRSGLPLAHRGELLLWLGRVAEAREDLARAISVVRGTRWAYIGLTMADILSGDPEKALETSAAGVQIMQNTEGPAVFVHRGEALRRLGRLDESAADLERSAQLHPRRVGPG